jgi:alanine racemase
MIDLGRRQFANVLLAAGGVVAAATKGDVAANAAVVPLDSTKGFTPWIEVSPSALVHNADEISQSLGGRKIVAVVKTNGYGLGDVTVARSLDRAPSVWGYAVVRPNDALRIRGAGVRKPILLMEATVTVAEAISLARQGVQIALGRDSDAAMFTEVAHALGRPVEVQLNVDSGFGRMGHSYPTAANWIKALSREKSLIVRGCMTYLSGSQETARLQLDRFESVLKEVRAAQVNLELVHVATSMSILGVQESWLPYNAIRPGLLLYGVYPDDQMRRISSLNLKVAHQLKARVARIDYVMPEAGLICGTPSTVVDRTWIATLLLGVHDGLRFKPHPGADKMVLIKGRLYPLAPGRSYNHSVVRLDANSEGVKVGDVVTIFGWEHLDVHPNNAVDSAYWQAFYHSDLVRISV